MLSALFCQIDLDPHPLTKIPGSAHAKSSDRPSGQCAVMLRGYNRGTEGLQSKYNRVTNSRRMAENGFAPPPLGNFADISYLVEN